MKLTNKYQPTCKTYGNTKIASLDSRERSTEICCNPAININIEDREHHHATPLLTTKAERSITYDVERTRQAEKRRGFEPKRSWRRCVRLHPVGREQPADGRQYHGSWLAGRLTGSMLEMIAS